MLGIQNIPSIVLHFELLQTPGMDPIKERMGVKGFTSQFSQCPYTIPKQGAVVVFDNALSNVDNCYNTDSGVFTAHTTGVYSFYFSGLLASDDKNGFTDLVLESTTGQALQYIFLRSRSDIFIGSQGSFDVKVKLNRGDQVQVRHLRGDLDLKGKSQTVFSGVLEAVYADPMPQAPA